MPIQDQTPDQIPATPGVKTGIPGPAGALVNALVNIHNSRKNAAVGQLNQMLTAAHSGFPIDPKAVEKTAKRAGLPLMHPDDMKGLQESEQQQSPSPGPAKNELGDSMPSAKQPDPYTQAYNVKAITDVKERQKVETNHAVDGMIRTAVTNHQLQGNNEQATLKYTGQLLELKQAALNGDARSLGKLAQAGEVKIDIPTAVWTSYDPTQKYKYLEMSRGAETEAQRNLRIQTAATHLIDQGSFDSPEAAYQAATTLADGKGLTPEEQAHMKPVSLGDMAKEVKIVGDLGDIGFSGNQIWSMARGAGLVGMASYFPKNFTPIQQKLLAVKQQAVGVEAMNARTSRMSVVGFTDAEGKKIPGRLETEAATAPMRAETEREMAQFRMQTLAQELDLKAKTAEQKNSLDQYKALVDLKRAKGTGAVSDAVMMAAEKDVASKFGVKLVEVNNLMHFLTGGTHLESAPGGADFAPATSPEVPMTSSPGVPDTSEDPATAGAGRPQ